ncbi:hypothetical protein GSY74_00310 [Sulfurovum sp. bin170]|uniref:hypothetical protein n=1 Tax=Sulfurovum sp. bin170 TaxID=2695268 RepID=UPI0013DF8F6F|nr:hypothetical protein [Sulfurovum sp. bin170]NEW59713.1 hypothetical protein [Sulfurovum sp. bin170]
MLSLGVELIAILLLTAVVGLLMGRFLCKSGESEEREDKRKVIHAFNTSENELGISREKVKDQSLRMTEIEDTIARREQRISNLETKLLSSDKQRGELLEELKILEKYKPRFESIENEFKIQSTVNERLKSEKIDNQEKIDKFQILTTNLNANIYDLKERKKELEKSVDNLQKRIKTDNSNNKKMEQSKDDIYDKLKQDSQRVHKEIIRTKDEDYERLEQNKSKAYQKMLETKNELYQELRDELESVESEYEEFKINYNLDSDRLETLEKENKKIYNTLDTIAHERDDLLARLRAISSVVGAVGVDNSSESRQLLLEN